jgi:hypothetical protein
MADEVNGIGETGVSTNPVDEFYHRLRQRVPLISVF